MSDSFKKELLFDLGLLLLIAAVFLGGFAYFRLEFGRFAEKRSALSAKMDAHGPWVEQGVWAADDGSAYMLPPDEPYTPTAYFFIRGEWRAFAVVCAPSYSLWFEDPETGERAFESDFDLDETTVTLRRVKRSDTAISARKNAPTSSPKRRTTSRRSRRCRSRPQTAE